MDIEKLNNLHSALTETLLDKVTSGDAKAGDLNVARQFLKDNGIECIPTENNKMDDLMKNLPDLEAIDFTDKLVAIFGLGDQEDYAEYFCDAMEPLRDIVESKGAIVVGNWSTDGYEFEASKALVDENTFIGLCIDEDRQSELTEARVDKWLTQLNDEMCLAEFA